MQEIFLNDQNHKKAFILMIACTLFTSIGQLLWKLGIVKINFSLPLSLLNFPFLLGFVSYGVGASLMILAFKNGELSILYPLIATSYVWISIFSPLLFSTDSMNIWKWSGVFMIVFSVSLLGWGSSKKDKKDKVNKYKVNKLNKIDKIDNEDLVGELNQSMRLDESEELNKLNELDVLEGVKID
ncbi:MAG: hypothetical protein ABH824_00370 [Nanoarchaeota archaeon]|nr:hypothetical protein [Nanoarchaeota archaeon]MBU1632866.1 hypothetical protein [Nanoarchaeota archaeon]MBU1876672.1 hypothetical protein [Nanoarchaeota archaeon]